MVLSYKLSRNRIGRLGLLSSMALLFGTFHGVTIILHYKLWTNVFYFFTVQIN